MGCFKVCIALNLMPALVHDPVLTCNLPFFCGRLNGACAFCVWCVALSGPASRGGGAGLEVGFSAQAGDTPTPHHLVHWQVLLIWVCVCFYCLFWMGPNSPATQENARLHGLWRGYVGLCEPHAS